jgi:hypothetical protein
MLFHVRAFNTTNTCRCAYRYVQIHKRATLMDSRFVLAYKELKCEAHQLKLQRQSLPHPKIGSLMKKIDFALGESLSLSLSTELK